jgi:hypothetical protein
LMNNGLLRDAARPAGRECGLHPAGPETCMDGPLPRAIYLDVDCAGPARLFFRYPELMENHGHRCACKDDDAYDGCCKKSKVNFRHEANPLS